MLSCDHLWPPIYTFVQSLHRLTRAYLWMILKSEIGNITFLDLIVKLSTGRFTTDLHIKIQIDTSIFNLTPLIKIISKYRLFTAKRYDWLKSALLKMTFYDTEMKWSHGFRGGTLRKMFLTLKWKNWFYHGNFSKSSNKNKGVPFVLTYHPLLKAVNYIITKHIHLLYMNEEGKKVFQPGPMVSF